MYNPTATYRIQFHKGFTFSDFEKQLEYLRDLGIKTIYASPVFTATPGSTHGYDALNPLEINPEIGTLEQLRKISARLREMGIGWLQDIVPNHMAYDTRNPWLHDVLEKGRQSVYAGFFDVTWNETAASGHIMAPFLGKPLEAAIRDGEITLQWNGGRLILDYYGSRYPLRARSYQAILQGEAPSASVRQWLQQLEDLQGREEPHQFSAGFDELLLQLTSLMKNETVGNYVATQIAAVNDDKDQLLQLANDQVYRLCHWQETDGKINYRRFFTVNGLICLNMQNEGVFQAFHQLIAQLVREGIFQGLRIDHVDGLYDPATYLARLRNLVGPDCYLVVEKILELNEELPQSWPIEGTSGYDFLAQINQLLTDARGEAAFTQYYYGIAGDHRTVAQQVRDKKAHILYHHMGGELEQLYQLLLQQLQPGHYAHMRTEDLKTAIAEFLIHMPVYRFYGNALPFGDREAAWVGDVMDQARISRPDLSPALGLLEHILLAPPPDEVHEAQVLHLYKRLQQLSGPLMAKGVEDTLLYTFFRYIGNNEVGDTPGQFGWTADDLHRALAERQAEWPLALNGTSTHDTKRGEDVRARLQALSGLPGQWMAAAKDLLTNLPAAGPDLNDAYFIAQTVIASYPPDQNDAETYAGRLEAYVEKALRESKRRSDWARPDSAYEDAAKAFARSIAAPAHPAWTKHADLRERVTEHGILNSLVQVTLKCTAPGTPDIYQGCEGWDFSFVDPDNRRPVAYDLRNQWLEEDTEDSEEAAGELWKNRRDGRIKFWLTRRLLHLRHLHTELLLRGTYLPLKIEGKHKAHVFAFARRHGGKALVVAVPLHTAALAATPEAIDWEDTRVLLPKGFGVEWQDHLQGRNGASAKGLPLSTLFEGLPLCVLEMEAEETGVRRSGLLLHLSSLPSSFGIGDMGPEAYRFADFLVKSRQQYWQLLPINPTEGGQAHSPYSSTSSHAGNRLLISPELLAAEGLLPVEILQEQMQPQLGKTDYPAAEGAKDHLLDLAWNAFKSRTELQEAFEAWCAAEASWLDDFARYSLLKKRHGGLPWYEWPEALKLRAAAALEELDLNGREELRAVRWEQYVFSRQWNALKAYCNDRNIRLIGDLPFYVSYDSADVWAHRSLFRLDEEGRRLGLAGVPPDAFSADGQLWGMPVFDWTRMKEENYDWWVERLRRNSNLFDLVRLDHFRAFAAYWEVPGGETTAVNGRWVEGPGSEFFEVMRLRLGSLPFVAEDLGDIDDAVLELRDRFALPGMKVLQFAFGEDQPGSPHIPHNYDHRFIAYTGTHDNNTTRGWYRHEADDTIRQRLDAYVGRTLTEDEVPHLLCRMALSSVADTAILPVQDLLGLDELGRMNTPASGENNWSWRLLPGQLTKEARRLLRQWTELYGRRG